MSFGGYIKAFGKMPGHPFHAVWIRNDLKEMQRFIDGFIETVTLDRDVVLICDEEGLLKGKRFNATVGCIDIMGDFLVVGVDGEEFADCPILPEEFKDLYMEED